MPGEANEAQRGLVTKHKTAQQCAEMAGFVSSREWRRAISLDCHRAPRAQDLDYDLPVPRPNSYTMYWCPVKNYAKVWAAGDPPRES